MAAAITSIGAITGHGLGCGRLLEAVLAGRTAIQKVSRFSCEGLCSSLAAEAPSDAELVDAAAGLGQAPAADRSSRLLLAAASEALRGQSRPPSRRRAVLVGTTKGALELAFERWDSGEVPRDDTLGAPARALALATGSQGPVLTLSAACASSAVAIGEALALIEDGTCDEAIVGGTEALHSFVYRGFHSLKALSPSPAAPFDVGRSGLSLGEGAAVLVLEALETAHRGGRAPIAIVEGFGSSTDGFDQLAPEPTGTGLVRACRRAMERAGIDAKAVDRYHAHGTATVHNDRMEAMAHAALFAGRAVPVCAAKGSIGHTLGAAGALDVAICALTLRHGIIPPVANLRELDALARVPAVIGTARSDDGPSALVVSAGFGGINAALLLRRPEAVQ
jgi:3-oxoacyl-[acyl-carrier-protein] synthase II